jgi:hypothetical protein
MSSQKQQQGQQFPTEFGSTKNKHVKGNTFVNDFVFSLDKQDDASSSSKVKGSKFVPRAQRLAAAKQAEKK